MPMNWRKRDAVFLVLAACYADMEENVCDDALKFSGRFPEIAKLCGEEVTYYALKNFFKEVATKACQLRADRDQRYGSVRPADSRSTRPARRGPRRTTVLEPDDIQAIEEARWIVAEPLRFPYSQPKKKSRFSPIDLGTPPATDGVEPDAGEVVLTSQAQIGASASRNTKNSVNADQVLFSSLEGGSKSSEGAIVAKTPAARPNPGLGDLTASRSQENNEDIKRLGTSPTGTRSGGDYPVPISYQHSDLDAAIPGNETGMPQKTTQDPPRTSNAMRPGIFLLPESRECALCDVYFKGRKAFENHESKSELHRRNLDEADLVAKAEMEIGRRHIQLPAPAERPPSYEQNEAAHSKDQQDDTVIEAELAQPLRNTMPPPPPPFSRFVASENTIIDISEKEKGKMRAMSPAKHHLERLRRLYPTLPEQTLRRLHEMASPTAMQGLISTRPKRKRRWYEELNERAAHRTADVETLPSSDEYMVPSNCDDAADSDYYYSESA